jgi:hypothetical protein
MSTIAVNVWRRNEAQDHRSDFATDLQRARLLANLLDAKFSIMGFKFGLDAIIGLIPGIGDTVALMAGIYPIYLARKWGLGKRVERRMKWNLAIDYFIGLVPVIGDFFDAAYKSNLKNVALLEQAAAARRVG